jgi:hypothetical protein
VTLERELAALAAETFPETPDLAPGVAARLGAERTPRRAGRRRLALAVALAAVALGAALAVPDARSTIFGWLGIGGVEVRFVDELPAVAPGAGLPLGQPTSLQAAAAQVRFRLLRPGDELGPPDTVYVGHFAADEVTFLYGEPGHVRMTVTEAGGALSLPFALKFVSGRGAGVRTLQVGGRDALWIEGVPHELLFLDRRGEAVSAALRLGRNALLWQRDGVFLRIEGALTLEQALRAARALR